MAVKRYLLRDSEGYYFQSVSGNGLEAHFTAHQDRAFHFSKDAMAIFRSDYSYIKGRVVLVKPSRVESNTATTGEAK